MNTASFFPENRQRSLRRLWSPKSRAKALRWLLCYEEGNRDVCHLQKAAPKHWFQPGERIRVGNCPTRFGRLSWSTVARSHRSWEVQIAFPSAFTGDLWIHIHPPDGQPLRHTSAGTLSGSAIRFTQSELQGGKQLSIQVS